MTQPEIDEPRTGDAPVPAWLWILAVVLTFWAGLYVAFNSGGFQSDIFNSAQVSWEGGGGAAAGPPDPMVIGKRIYTANCVVCHQATGEGVAGQFPPLVGSEWVVGGDWVGDNHLVKILLGGMQGPVQVKGNSYNNAMPAWSQLSDREIASVLTYIRNEWGNSAPPISEEYVASVRAASDRTQPWTQRDLQAIEAESAGAAPAPAPTDGAPADAAPDAAPPQPEAAGTPGAA